MTDKQDFINTLVDKWGVENISDGLKNINEYEPRLYFDVNKDCGYFYLDASDSLIDGIKDNLSDYGPVFAEDSEIKKKTPITWTVYLSKKPGKVDIPELKIVPFPKGYYFDLDKGHLLAKEFMQYIGSNIEELRPFFYKNKRSNIIYQFKNVNRNGNGKYGQSLFETRVIKEIEENNSNIYYQIEPVFYYEQDEIPIGTRIIAFRDTDNKSDFNLDKKDIKVPFHVFVSNYDDSKDNVKKYPKNINGNRDFYKYGLKGKKDE